MHNFFKSWKIGIIHPFSIIVQAIDQKRLATAGAETVVVGVLLLLGLLTIGRSKSVKQTG